MIRTDAETMHVFAVDLPMPEAASLADDGARLSAALGGIEVEPDRAHALDTRTLADLGLSHYLVEGEGADPDAVRLDSATLDGVKGPVLILRPRAVNAPPVPQAPLRHLGSYRMDRPAPATAPLRTASAETMISGVPPAAPQPATRDRRQNGVVATVALLVALFVALVMWVVAS